MNKALTFIGLRGPTGSLLLAQGRFRLVFLVSVLNWLLIIIAVGHTGWIDGNGKRTANPTTTGTDFHFGLQNYRYFEKVTFGKNVHTVTVTYYPADDALRLANENNASTMSPVSLGPLSAVLGLLVTCIVLQTFVLLALAQKRFGFFSDNAEARWRPRVCKAAVSIFTIAAVGTFANSGYKDALQAGFEHDAHAVVWYGDGYGCAVAAIVFSLLETVLVFLFAGDLEQVAQYYLELGASQRTSGGMMDAAAQLGGGLAAHDDPHTAALEAVVAGDGSSSAPAGGGSGGAGSKTSYSKLTPEERAAILSGEGGAGGYQGSSAYANL